MALLKVKLSQEETFSLLRIFHIKFPFQFVLVCVSSLSFLIRSGRAQTGQPKNNSQSNDIVSLSVSLFFANDCNLNLAISK